MQTMYDGVNGSPSNKLLNLISSSATSIVLDSTSNLPVAPNIATIGDSSSAEVILYTGKSSSTLTGVTRGFGGTTARSWAANTPVYRAFTKYDYDAIKLNINTIGAATSTNLLIDGGFQIWLAGTSFTNPAASSYTATMWKLNSYNPDGGTFPTSLVHEKIQSPSETAGNIYRINTNGAGSGYGNGAAYGLRQQIEHGTRRYAGAGKKVTVSFRARSSIAGKKIGVMLYQNYGTGGSPSAGEATNGANFTLTAEFQTFTHTFELNTLSGKTFGTEFDDSFSFDFRLVWGSSIAPLVGASTAETFGGSGTIDICEVQFNPGDVTLPFVARSFGDELRSSQRFYEKSYDVTVIPGAVSAAGLHVTSINADTIGNGNRWGLGSHPRFKVDKRVTPTITLYTVDGIAGTWFIATANRACSIDNASRSGFFIANNTGSAVTTSVGEAHGHWVADARM